MWCKMGLTLFFKYVFIKNLNDCLFVFSRILLPVVYKLFCVTLSKNAAYFITVLSKNIYADL